VAGGEVELIRKAFRFMRPINGAVEEGREKVNFWRHKGLLVVLDSVDPRRSFGSMPTDN